MNIKRFVENRVQEIRKHTNTLDWYYCQTKDNPADIITRMGKAKSNLARDRLWWGGPSFLRQIEMPIQSNDNETESSLDTIELKNTKILIAPSSSSNTPLSNKNLDINNVIKTENFGSYHKLLRVTAWIYRFITNLKLNQEGKPIRRYTILHPDELRNAEISLIKANQYDIRKVFYQGKLSSKFRDLNLVVDENDVLRCKGRLEFSPLPYETKNPFLIDPNHPLADLIVVDIHKRCKHALQKQTLTELRQRFWITQGRNFVRKIIHRCTGCRKKHCKSYQYPPSQALTQLRLNDTRVFFTTGVDNFGPFYVKQVFIEANDNNLYKAWVTLYTCAASRAILLDLVPRPDSESFIRSFRRFVARRGCPDNMISDNGKNFISRDTQEFISKLQIEWHVNLPLAPWHGGFFERLVRSVKELLIKDLHQAKLNYEEMVTVLCEIEQIINNRPISYLYPTEFETCLTPNHLLFGHRLEQTSSKSSPLSVELYNISQHSANTQRIIDHFWNRWRREYVVNLRESHKFQYQNQLQPKPQINDVVLVHDNNLPRFMWRLGRITELIKGHDDQYRGAIVRTQTNSELRRPINLLYPVECIKPETKALREESPRVRREAAVIGELKRKFVR